MTNFSCPMCAATIVYQNEGATIYCPNCTNTVIVPDIARQQADPFALVGAPEMSPSPDWLDEVRARLNSDGKIMAIKLCRERAGLGLKEAKDAVDAIERGESPEVAPFIPSGNMASVQAALRAGQKITAIKIYRDLTGLGLKEAKDAVEQMEREIPANAAPQLIPPNAPAKAGCFSALALLAMGVILWLAWFS